MAHVHVVSRRSSRFGAFRRPFLAAALPAESMAREPRAWLSLRARLLGWAALGMIVSLAVGGVIACLDASRSSRAEMSAALVVAERTARHALDTLISSNDARRDLERPI